MCFWRKAPTSNEMDVCITCIITPLSGQAWPIFELSKIEVRVMFVNIELLNSLGRRNVRIRMIFLIKRVTRETPFKCDLNYGNICVVCVYMCCVFLQATTQVRTPRGRASLGSTVPLRHPPPIDTLVRRERTPQMPISVALTSAPSAPRRSTVWVSHCVNVTSISMPIWPVSLSDKCLCC